MYVHSTVQTAAAAAAAAAAVGGRWEGGGRCGSPIIKQIPARERTATLPVTHSMLTSMWGSDLDFDPDSDLNYFFNPDPDSCFDFRL